MNNSIESENPQNVRLRIRVGLPEVELPGSPLLASIAKTDVDPRVRPEDEHEFRGVIEILLNGYLDDISAGKCGLAHIALSTDPAESTQQLEFNSEKGVLVSSESVGSEKFTQIETIDSSVYENQAFQNFVGAFKNLKLREALDRQQGFANQPLLMSKVDLYRHLELISPDDWKQPLVEYLIAYKDLVSFADAQDSDWLKFWVRYPFSVSVWNTSSENARLASVMISPFHPLRLSWLASVESVLRNADGRWTKFLAGGVVGWQFPYFSVSRHAAGRLLALPLDGGHESLFAGWSMMVPVQVDGFSSLEVPERAADLMVPGVASDGLSANSVASATNKFFDLHPFMSSIAVDLSSRVKTPKSEAVDSGLVQAITNWRERRIDRGLPEGGVKIFDSVNRDGDISPNVIKLAGDESRGKSTFSWVRYEGQQPSEAVNIRVLGDSGLNYVAGNMNAGIRSSSIGTSFLRRYEVVGARADGLGAYLEPTLLEGEYANLLDRSFFDALCIHEDISGQIQTVGTPSPLPEQAMGMRFEVQSGSSTVLGADWIIGGDSSLPPTILSKMLRRRDNADTAGLTIWDWHPPMFGSSSSEVVGNIDLRPYVVVSKLTEAFKGRLDMLLRSCDTRLNGDPLELGKMRAEVLDTLGSRGVGISSLFANHKHKTPQRGAMGFWTTLDLLSKIDNRDREILAIPLDKIDKLVDALCGRKADDRRRADLLLIEISEKSLRLSAVEIKFLRLDRPSSSLADPLGNDDELSSAFGQVDVAQNRCTEIVDQLQEEAVSDRATQLLRWNALATLIDIGIRLSPTISKDLSRRQRVASWLHKVASSSQSLELKTGNPLVAYFEAHVGQMRSYVGQPVGRNGAVLFQADPRDAMTGRTEKGEIQGHFARAIELVFPHEREGSQFSVTPRGDDQGDSTQRIDSSDTKIHVGVSGETSDDQEANRFAENHHENANCGLSEDSQTDRSGADTSDPLERQSEVDSYVIDSKNDRGIRIQIGSALHDGEAVVFWPGNTSLGNPNVGIVGEMGSGKTQLCLSLVALLRKSASLSQNVPISGLILDPKGDYSRADREDFYSAAGVTVLQPSQLPIELIAVREDESSQSLALKISAFADMFGRVLGRDFGAVQRERLREAIRGVVDLRRRSPLISEIYAAYKLLAGDKRDTVTSRLGELVDLGIFTNNPAELVPINTLLADRVVVLNLEGLFNHVSIQEQLMAIFVNQFQSALRSQTKWPIRRNEDGDDIRTLNLFLLIDEASMVMRHEYPQLEDILRTGREYGVMTIMSSQFLGDFDSDAVDYGQSLRTWFVHQQSQVAKKELNDLGLPDSPQILENLRQLATHQCLYSTHPGPAVLTRGRPWHEVAAEFGT
jgi:DNA phosphorothioation-dependent restriction protein DptH